jgi:1-acyl-sn-glycerol-3-phosphate acyltransferase
MTVVPDERTVPNVVHVTNRWTATLKGVLAVLMIWVVGLVFIVLTPVAVPLVALSDLVRKSEWGGVRTWRFLLTYLVVTLLSNLVMMFHGLVFPFLRQKTRWAWCWWIQRWWAKQVSKGLTASFKLKFELEGQDDVPRDPVILLARHVSMADTVLPLLLFSVPRKTRFRYVLKDELLWEGVFNFVGRRMPTVFVRRGSDNKAAEVERVAELGVGLGQNDGVVIYPEGTRYTQAKMDRVKAKLKDAANPDLRAHAERVQYLLPLRTAGILAVMDRAPGTHVVILGHEGFDKARTFRDLWSGVLVGQTIHVNARVIPPEEIPTETSELEPWLFAQWEQLDDWVGARKRARKAT